MAGSATGCVLSARVLRRDAVKIRDEGSCGTRRCISPSAFFPTARRRYSVSGLEWLRRVPRSDQRRTSRTIVQTCIVHLLRNSMSFASWKDRNRARKRSAPLSCRGPGRPKSVRAGPLGQTAPGHCPELASTLGPGDPIIRVSRRRAPDHLHNERGRGAQLEATARSPDPQSRPR